MRSRFLRMVVLVIATAGAPVARAAETAVLTFLHTNDLHGRVLSGRDFEDATSGGLARAAALASRIRGEMPHVAFVDSGDLLHGTPVAYLDKGRSMVDAMNAAGIDVSCPGNHEFDWGQSAALDAFRRARFAWVSANIGDRGTGRPFGPLKPYLVRKLGPVRVAFLGLTTLETVKLEWGPLIDRVRFDDPIEVARRLVPRLRAQADLVVVLTHLGVHEDFRLAGSVPGIDLILGGHSHSRIDERIEVNGTLIAQAGSAGQYLGRVDLRMERTAGDRWRIQDINGRQGRWWPGFPDQALLPLGPEVRPNAGVARAYRASWERWKRLARSIAGRAADRISHEGGAGGDTPLSRFLADRLREATGADLALIDGRAIGVFEAGDFDVRSLWSTFGGYTGQNVLAFEVTGAQIREFLEFWSASSPSFPIGVSGLKLEASSVAPPGARVLDARIGGQPVTEMSRYRIAGLMYVLRRFPMLFRSAPSAQSGPILWSRDLVLRATRAGGRAGFRSDSAPRIVVR